MDVLKGRQALYNFIEEQKRNLDGLYPIIDNLEIPVTIECPNKEKNLAPAHVRDNYELIFEDTFDGQLDPNKWNTAYAWGPDLTINNEEQYYIDTLGGAGWQPGFSPFSFSADGNLVITAAPITGTKPVTVQGVSGGQPFSSGVITTRDSCCFTHGYVEVCLKDPCCPSGMWTAAWLLNCLFYNNSSQKDANENGGVQGVNKFNPEIDFKETVNGGGVGCDAVSQAYHYFTGDRLAPAYSRWSIGSNFNEIDVPSGNLVSTNNLYQDCNGVNRSDLVDGQIEECEFHTVAVDWCPDYINMYVDGEIVNCITNNFQPNDPIVTDQSMYLLINFAVGGEFPFPSSNGGGQADPNDYPASMEIRYARIYAHPEGHSNSK